MSVKSGVPLPCVDKLTAVEQGRVRGERHVKPEEEYFQDHFSRFPILPGVLMLEGLSQISSWHVRYKEDFKHSQVRMIRVKQAKFVTFVKPGDRIEFESELTGQKANVYEYKGKVIRAGKTVASAAFTLESSKIDGMTPEYAALEDPIIQRDKEIFSLLTDQKAACI